MNLHCVCVSLCVGVCVGVGTVCRMVFSGIFSISLMAALGDQYKTVTSTSIEMEGTNWKYSLLMTCEGSNHRTTQDGGCQFYAHSFVTDVTG